MLSDYQKALIEFNKIPPPDINGIPAERCSDPKQVAGSTWFRQDEVTKRAILAKHWNYRADLAIIDSAKSAFHEENFGPTAQLSLFLERVKAGHFKGEHMLITWAHENRFTRAKIGNGKAKLKEFTDNDVAIYFASSDLLLLKGWEHDANIDNRLTWAFDAARKEIETRQEYAFYSHKKKRTDLAAGLIVNTGQYPRWIMFEGTSNKLPGNYVKSDELVFPDSDNLMTYWDLAVRIKSEAVSDKALRQIINDLNTEKIPCFRGGKKWMYGSLVGFLRSKSLIGFGTFTVTENSEAGEVKTIKEFKIYPPVATDEEWNAIQHRLDKNRGHSGPNAMSGGVNTLFPHMVTCSECGEILHTQAREKGLYSDTFNRRYKCRHYQLAGGCSASGSLATAPLEEDFFGVFLQQYPAALVTNQDQELNKKIHAKEAQVNGLRTEVADYQSALKAAKNATAKIAVTQLLNDSGEKLEKAEQELKTLSNQAFAASIAPETLNTLQATLRKLDADPANPEAWRKVELTNEILKQQLSDPESRRKITELIPDLVGGLIVNFALEKYDIKNLKGEIIASRDLSVVLAALRKEGLVARAKLIQATRKKNKENGAEKGD